MNARLRGALAVTVAFCAGALPVAAEEAQRDAQGRPILRGPLPSGVYAGVRIVSSSVGIYAVLPTTIVDSVIEAPVCVSASGRHLTLRGNVLDCALCVEFTEGFLANNDIADNRCTGRGTNRPDVLGW